MGQKSASSGISIFVVFSHRLILNSVDRFMVQAELNSIQGIAVVLIVRFVTDLPGGVPYDRPDRRNILWNDLDNHWKPRLCKVYSSSMYESQFSNLC